MKRSVVVIDPKDHEAYRQLAEADMRRFWSNRCKHHEVGGELFIDLGNPRTIRNAEGVKRLASFTIQATIQRREIP